LGNAGVALGAGVLFGLVTMLVEYVGIFMTGFLTGLYIGVILMLIVTSFIPTTNLWVTIGVLFGTGLVLALVTLKWQRLFLLLGTSLMGGALVATSLDYIVEKFRIILWFWNMLNHSRPSMAALCWFSWLLLTLWPTVFLVGIIVQWRITSVGYIHKGGFRQFLRKRRSSTEQPLTLSFEKSTTSQLTTTSAAIDISSQDLSRSRNEISANSQQPKPFRHLYQKRRAHGDVICQSYMGNLQRPQLDPTGQTAISSDQTVLTVIS